MEGAEHGKWNRVAYCEQVTSEKPDKTEPPKSYQFAGASPPKEVKQRSHESGEEETQDKYDHGNGQAMMPPPRHTSPS